jgi:hypothetical protein
MRDLIEGVRPTALETAPLVHLEQGTGAQQRERPRTDLVYSQVDVRS